MAGPRYFLRKVSLARRLRCEAGRENLARTRLGGEPCQTGPRASPPLCRRDRPSRGRRRPPNRGGLRRHPARRFSGPPPWFVSGGFGLEATDDVARLYEDALVAIDPGRGINNGQPSLHALSIDALALKEGETIVQIGAGAGYYTAILARLVGPSGRVIAYEIEPDIAARARANLARFSPGRASCAFGRRGGAACSRRNLCQRRRLASAADVARCAECRRTAHVSAPGGAFDRGDAARHPAGTRRRMARPVSLRNRVHRLRRRPGRTHGPKARRRLSPRRMAGGALAALRREASESDWLRGDGWALSTEAAG